MKIYLFLLFAFFGLTSCQEVTLVVRTVPSNTPNGSKIFITGNFNHWNPGDKKFQLTKLDNGLLGITLPKGFGEITYKFTRGDWTTQEHDACGSAIDNRTFELGTDDTIFVDIESWKDLGPTDCEEVTILIDKLPETTPKEDDVYMACNFNDWDEASPDYKLQKNKDGQYFIRLPYEKENLEFKFTRGTWESEELDKAGNIIENRVFEFGNTDTLRVKIDNWRDIKPCDSKPQTLAVKVPANTPPFDGIYLAGEINGWNSKDEKFKMVKAADGKFYLTLPKEMYESSEYKITRGSWDTQEADMRGQKHDNRTILCGWRDTINIEIVKWYDRPQLKATSSPTQPDC
jgi:hypothetical protein